MVLHMCCHGSGPLKITVRGLVNISSSDRGDCSTQKEQNKCVHAVNRFNLGLSVKDGMQLM